MHVNSNIKMFFHNLFGINTFKIKLIKNFNITLVTKMVNTSILVTWFLIVFHPFILKIYPLSLTVRYLPIYLIGTEYLCNH